MQIVVCVLRVSLQAQNNNNNKIRTKKPTIGEKKRKKKKKISLYVCIVFDFVLKSKKGRGVL